ncbi:hypothetical protein D9M69_724400 [compost metagenome]
MKTPDTHGPFDPPFERMKASTYSKVQIARLVAPKLTNADIGEQLHEEVVRLAERIRKANGFPARD